MFNALRGFFIWKNGIQMEIEIWYISYYLVQAWVTSWTWPRRISNLNDVLVPRTSEMEVEGYSGGKKRPKTPVDNWSNQMPVQNMK